MSRFFYYLFNASVIFNFFQPENSYFTYLDRYVSLYEIFIWIAIALILIAFKPIVNEEINTKIIERMDKPLNVFLRYVDYLFVAFVGVFVGDTSLFVAMVISCIIMFCVRDTIKTRKAKA